MWRNWTRSFREKKESFRKGNKRLFMTCNRYSTRTRFNLPFYSFFNFLSLSSFQILSLSSSSFRDLGFTWIFKLSFFFPFSSKTHQLLLSFPAPFLLSQRHHHLRSFILFKTHAEIIIKRRGRERKKEQMKKEKKPEMQERREIGERGGRDQEKRGERNERSERHFGKREVI